MGFNRTFDSAQTLAVLAALPGTVVQRVNPPQAPIGAGSGCVLFVGEVVNDQGGDADLTLVDTIREITSGDQIVDTYGGLSDQIGTAATGWEGNLAKALAIPGLQFARLAVIAPDLEAGEVTLTRPATGTATVTPAASAPWRFDPGDTLVISVNGGGDETATFDAARASVTGSGLAISNLDGDTLQLRIDDGDIQTVTFTSGETNVATVVAKINAVIEGGHAEESTGQVKIVSDTYGTDSGVTIITGGTALTELGLTATDVNGTGDVANIRAVTAAELKTIVEADTTAAVNATTGAVSTPTAGAAGSIKVQTSSTVEGTDKLNISTTIVTGGTTDAAATTIPAGTRVSNGSTRVYLTLETLTFAAGASGTALSQSVRVRPQTDSTGSIAIGACSTIVDTLDDTSFSVTNAAELTPPDFDTAYSNALAASLGDTGIAALVDYVICRRHTAAVHVALRAHGATAASGKRPRSVFIAPAVGTANATAVGSSGAGVGTSRTQYASYHYPGFQTRLGDAIGTLINMHADIPAAHLSSVMAPETNIGENRDALVYVLGLETGLDVTPTKAQYQAWLEAGIMPLQVVNGKAEFLNDVTTELTAPGSRLHHVRMVNYLTASLHDIGSTWSKKLRSRRNKEGIRVALEEYFDSLLSAQAPESQRIEAYSIDETSGNTVAAIAAGLHIIKILVQTLSPMDVIVFTLEAGKTVKVTAQAIAAAA